MSKNEQTRDNEKHSHTPGPWTLRKPTGSQRPDQKYDYGISALIPHLKEEKIIAETFGQVVSYKRDVESLANAHLIAAAPDLLEALEETILILEDEHETIECGDVFSISKTLYKAIAKARGAS